MPSHVPSDAAHPRPVLVLTDDPALAEQVATVAASIGLPCSSAGDRGAGRAPTAAVVVVGADLLGGCAPAPGDLVAARDDQRVPAEVAAHRLPSGRAGLARALSEAAGGHRGGAVVGVLGAAGGAGASTLALALAAAGGGWVVDLDPVRSGTEAATGAELVPGLRWPDLLELDGRLPPGALVGRLPVADGVPVLGWGALDDDAGPRRGPPAAALDAVLAAARADSALTVVDLPACGAASAGPAWRLLDAAVLVVPDAVPAAVAGRRLVTGLRAAVGPVHVVVRERRAGPGAEAVADVLGVPGAVRWRAHAALAGAADDGDLVDAVRRGPTAATARAVLRLLAVPT